MRIVKIFLPFLLLSLFSLCPFLPRQLPTEPTPSEADINNPPIGELNTPTTILTTPTSTTAEILPTPTPTNTEILPTPTLGSLMPSDLEEINFDNIQSLAIFAEIPYPLIQPGHTISEIKSSNDGTKLAIISKHSDTSKQALVVWDLLTNSQVFTIEDPPYYLQWLYFPPDNQELWVFCLDSFEQYNLQSGLLERTIDFYSTDKVGVSPDGRYFIRGIFQSVPNTSIIRFFNSKIDEPFYTEEIDYMITSFRYSPDSKMVAGSSGLFGTNIIKIWDTETGALIIDFNDYDCGPIFSSDSSMAAFGQGNQFSIYSTDSWALKNSFQNENPDSMNKPEFFLAGDQILAIQETASVTFYDVNTGDELLKLPEQVTIINFSPTMNIIFTNSSDENIKLWGIHQ